MDVIRPFFSILEPLICKVNYYFSILTTKMGLSHINFSFEGWKIKTTMMKKVQILLLLMACAFAGMAQEINVEHLKKMKIRNIGPAGMSGRVTSIDVDLSNPEIIYVGTASGGVWKSESGGARWTPIFDEQPVQAIGAVAINQKNPSDIWVGTGEGNPRNSHNSGEGIFRSLDGGKTWKHMGLENTRLIHRITVHRDNPDIVYVGVLGSAWGPNADRGVYKTTDGGKSWRKILYINDETGVGDMVVDPSNPNKLIVAMWEFGRKPWYFNSGGPGSGLHISYDGGESWKKITPKDGLPKGELGRIGLAIAPSKPNVVYALVEAKKNALYGSTDGGLKWRKISDKNIGNRPFYYADIYVDSKNENRIWNLWSYVSKSEDGGKTFKTVLDYGKRVHPDHHAFWIHPENPNYLINGNDGGLNISRDGGANWEFVDNLPVAQFYHINHDMDIPYNVAGGMQDNGSWIGPSEVWKSGGIRNEDWQEVLFGDGFDVILRRDNNRYGFGMSQGGNVSYFDRETGRTQYIRPVHPDGEELRFNWNAALAQHPDYDCGIYYGSQYVHRSLDCGQSWEIISPDLTSGDTAKYNLSQRSGGLTLDVTEAENYTTILCIAPSPKDKQVIWVGTDDGNLQLTRDGGKTWNNLASRLPGCPAGSWIPQIELSPHNAGEVFVVVNDYRRNNYQPYLYHTTDYGQTWARLANAQNVKGHVLSVVQDLVEPNLLFLGTDYGLYFSINKGSSWQKWNKNFPSTPVADMKIHPREHDLIIGTFGRSAWIMDDIRPLREICKTNGKSLEKEFDVFETPHAYLSQYRSVDGARFIADGGYAGENARRGAMITYWVKPPTPKKKEAEKTEGKKKKKKKGKKKKDKEETAKDGKKEEKKPKRGKKIKVTVLNTQGDTIRNFSVKADTAINRFYWNLSQNGVRYPSYRTPKPDADPPSGGRVLPGVYDLHFQFGDYKDSTQVTVKADPRLNITTAQMQARQNAGKEFQKVIKEATNGFNRLKEAKKTIKLVNDQLANAPDSTKKEIQKLGKSLQDSISTMMKLYMLPQDAKGIQRSANTLNTALFRANYYLRSSDGAPNQMARFSIKNATEKTEEILEKVNTFFEKDWKDYRAKVEANRQPLFKDYEPIKIE